MKFVGKRCDSVVRRANEWLLLLFCVCLTTLLFVSSHSSSSSSQPTIITSSSSPSPLSFSLCFPASSFIHLLAFALSHSLPQSMQWYVFRAELAAVATLTDEAFGGGFFFGKNLWKFFTFECFRCKWKTVVVSFVTELSRRKYLLEITVVFVLVVIVVVVV